MERTAGERLRMARDALGIKAEDVARQLGVTQQQVSAMENGKSKILDKYRRAWAEMLGLDRADLADWIAKDAEAGERKTKRSLAETVKVMDRFVDQYQELGHTYRRLDEAVERMTGLLEELVGEVRRQAEEQRRQTEMLRSLRESSENG